MKQRIFPLLIALSALSVSASAAFYSISGLSKLFAGASLQVIIMASSLEVAKLVIASLLYQYWNSINKVLRTYLVTASVVLVLITSMGIYGFLSAAYQSTANKEGIATQQINALETKKKLYEQTRDNIIEEKQSLANLKGTLSKGSVTQFTDKKGNLIIKSNNANVKQIELANKTEEKLTTKLDAINDSIFVLENKILETKIFSDSKSELGPLKYLSNLLGVTMDRIVNWLLLIIIFVFDPLAISLIVAANFAFAQLRPKKEEKIIEEPIQASAELKNEDIILNDNLEDENQIILHNKTLEEILNNADLNNDGYITDEEAKLAGLSPEIATKLNELNQSIKKVEDVNLKQKYDFNWNELDGVQDEIKNIKKLSFELGTLQSKPKKNDNNTITY